MKELSIKAKAYDEALSLMQDCIPDEDGLVHVKPEEIFPELKESEDERIRKELIEYHKAQAFLDGKPNNKHVKYVAWLEKQGEKPNNVYDKELSEILGRVIRRYINDPNIPYTEREKVSMEIIPYVERLEKQGEQEPIPKFKVGDVMRTLQEAVDNITDGMPVVVSIDEEYYHCNNELIAIKDQDEYEYPPMNRRQKPAWSVEDEMMLECTIDKISDLGTGKMCKEWLKDLKNRVQPQPKQEWSEEDKEELKIALNILEKAGQYSSAKWLKNVCLVPQTTQKPAWSEEDEEHVDSLLKRLKGMCKKGATFTTTQFAVNQDMDWLKSLKDRVLPQPKVEWSEEDENTLLDTINTLRSYGRCSTDRALWLMSLKERCRPQNTWKPSEEQIRVVARLRHCLLEDVSGNDVVILDNLLEQLKAL